MFKFEKMREILRDNNGYLLTSQVTAADISKTYMARFVKDNALEQVAHGVYADCNICADELYVLQLRNPKIVYSGETALYLHSLIDREYTEICVTVPSGHNGSRLRTRGVAVKTEKKEKYNIGIIEVETLFGNRVRTYDKERCICDLIINRKRTEAQTFQTAIKSYMNSKKKDLSLLIMYAEKLNIRDEVMKYIEVLV